MKKLMMILAVLAIGNMVFAAKATVSPVKVSYNQISTDSNGNLQQTVIADNGMSVTIGAELDEDTLKYTLNLDNITDPDYLMRTDCIRTYYGNFDKDEWVENTTSAFATTTTTTTTSTNSSSSISTEEACLIAGATCLCALTLAEICNATTSSSSPRVSSSSSRVSRTPSSSGRVPSVSAPTPRVTTRVVTPVPVFNWIIVDSDRSNNSSSVSRSYSSTTTTTTGLTSTVRTGSSYKGTFSVPANNGPDYRVRFTVSKNEYIDFYFSRSDRDNYANPLKDRTYGRHSLMLSCGIPDYNRWGCYYIYSGSAVGVYTGIQIETDDWLANDIGYTTDDNFANIKLNDYPYSWETFKVDSIDPNPLTTMIDISAGLTIKTVPHTWLMLGCGLDIVNDHYWCDVVDDSDNYVATGYIVRSEPLLAAAPEVGVNLIFDHFDIAATYKYSFFNGHRFDLMLGIAF